MKKNTIKMQAREDGTILTRGPIFAAVGIGKTVDESFRDMIRNLNARKQFLVDSGNIAGNKVGYMEMDAIVRVMKTWGY